MNTNLRLLDSPHFAPLYRFEDVEDTSLWNIIKKKGYLKVNKQLNRFVSEPGWSSCPPGYLIDEEIKRVKPTLVLTNEINDLETFLEKISFAMVKDALEAEKQFPGYTNVIMCGGKDSLNLLLIPWKNPVLVVSASPNFQLVKQFITDNDLKWDIIELFDKKTDLENEILINCCRLNIQHSVWGGHLKEIAINHNRKVIFWLGQNGDFLLTSKWRVNINLYPLAKYGYSYYKAFDTVFSYKNRLRFKYRIGNFFINQKKCFFNGQWERAAHSIGVYMTFLNEIVNAPVLSGYHGKECMKVFQSTNYPKVIKTDVREMIGEKLLKKPVIYPAINPSPRPYNYRKNISDIKTFLTLAEAEGVRIIS